MLQYNVMFAARVSSVNHWVAPQLQILHNFRLRNNLNKRAPNVYKYLSWTICLEARSLSLYLCESEYLRRIFSLFCRFCLEEHPSVQRLYDGSSTPPPTRVIRLSDKDQKDWVKDVQGITE